MVMPLIADFDAVYVSLTSVVVFEHIQPQSERVALNKNAKIPVYGSEYAAGADLYACLDFPVNIAPGRTKVIPTGIALELPVGYA